MVPFVDIRREPSLMSLLWQLIRLDDLKDVPQLHGPVTSSFSEEDYNLSGEEVTVKWMNLVLSTTTIGARVSVFGNEMTVRPQLLADES